ncbi:hypothetical protein TELCIR_06810 [Teladorsagia circumcincta]|uniref:Major facilitator superfamily (MFS) profile domain-containing protein n=1 Tax=Teladorsagia circumcincta TaxID=45464 RepID=A0A2G9UM22_TELCI|nr:hypothetical protein TELCIR_06810 [Teladorsagia circumcincta]
MENIPKKHRMWINMAITWSPNMLPFAAMAWLTGEWRSLALVNAIVCVPGLVFCFLCIHESPRWLIQRGKVVQAQEIMRREFGISKEGLIHENLHDVVRGEYEQTHLKTRDHGGLVRLRPYACNLTLGYADLKWRRIGRKFVHTSGLVIIVVCLALVIFAYSFDLNHTLKEEIRLLILLASSMTSQIYISSGIVGNELFPTPIRTLGYSFLQLWNRVGVVLSPFVFYSMEIWIALPYCIMSVLCLIDTLAFECLLPETKGKHLVEHMPGREERLLQGRKSRQAKERMEGLVAPLNKDLPI